MGWFFGTDAVMERREVAEAMWVAAKRQAQHKDKDHFFDFRSLWPEAVIAGASSHPEGLSVSSRFSAQLQRSGHTYPAREEANFSLSDEFKLASKGDGSPLVRWREKSDISHAAQQQQLDWLVAAGRASNHKGAPGISADTGFLIPQPPLHVELLKVTDTRTMLAMSLVCRGLRCASLELLRREQAAWCGDEYVPLSCKEKDFESVGGMSLKACRHRRILSLLCGTPEAGALCDRAVTKPKLEHGSSAVGHKYEVYNNMDVPLSQLRRTRLSQHSPRSYSTKKLSDDEDTPWKRKWPPSRAERSILQVVTFCSHQESPHFLEYLPAEHVGVLVEVSVPVLFQLESWHGVWIGIPDLACCICRSWRA